MIKSTENIPFDAWTKRPEIFCCSTAKLSYKNKKHKQSRYDLDLLGKVSEIVKYILKNVCVNQIFTMLPFKKTKSPSY